MSISFNICKGHDYCHSEEEIKAWMARKFLITLENAVVFNKNVIEEGEKLHKHSQLVWNIVSPQMRTEYYNYIHLSELTLYDQVVDVGLRKEEHTLFDTTQSTLKPWDFKDDVWVAITYELFRDVSFVNRQVYSLFDFLGDIGGLAGALFAAFGGLIIIF